jgi:hypothetical protein
MAMGAWQLGHYGLPRTYFQITTNIFAPGPYQDVTIKFRDESWITGSTTNWIHYCVTFSNGIVNAYQDGIWFTNRAIPGVTSLTVARQGSAPRWIGLGCATHDGTPAMESGENYPNHGWLNGYLDDVRIYNRVLDPAEIRKIVAESIMARIPVVENLRVIFPSS